MDENRNKSETAKDNRAVNLFALRLAVAAYLCYLGVDMLRTFLVGASTLAPAVAWGCGLGFPAAGLGFALYSYLRWRRETAARKGQAAAEDKAPDED